MLELAKREGAAATALAFAILTAARSGEVREMTWAEVDDADSVWTVPAGRIKAGKEHRVPLTPAARALLGERGDDDALVFPAPSDATKALPDMTLTAVLRRMGRGDLTAHGFRSTFRDWAGETTAHPREVIEAALAHRLKDKAEAAYARGDLFTKRRRLMEDWAAYLPHRQLRSSRCRRSRAREPWRERLRRSYRGQAFGNAHIGRRDRSMAQLSRSPGRAQAPLWVGSGARHPMGAEDPSGLAPDTRSWYGRGEFKERYRLWRNFVSIAE